MKLLSVDIQGFKSFAKRVHVSFKPGITGVIGPNGSGKSNVAEAIRWVLGEQSVKALRAKERSDVIYKGEAGAASKATVTLTFDNEAGRFPIAAGEIAITRVLTLQGESEYLVNNEAIRLIDLQQMLAEAGIGTKSYTVISQGTVDRYLTATPQGRKELFDEATGIKSLQIKVTLSRQKLEKTSHHADEVRAIVHELAPRVTLLKRQVDRYDLREKYEGEFRTKQLVWYHNAWHKAAEELGKLEGEQAELAKKIRDARAKRVSVEQETLQTIQAMQQHEGVVQAYERWKKEYENLTFLIEETKNERKRAQDLLVAQTKLPQSDWKQTARSVLQDCNTCINAFMTDTPWNASKLQKLQGDITQALSAEDTQKASDTTSLIQKAAQLAAIQEERERQLASLEEPKKPTPIHDDSYTDPSSRETLARNLETLREQEIHAQREDSAVASALEQLRRDIALLEQEILRECGTQALATITSSLPEAKEIPSDQELRTLSQKIASIGEKDPLVIKEYEEAKVRFDSLQSQLIDIEATMRDIQESIETVTTQMKENFQEQFFRIQTSFSEYFTELFGGGKAELEIIEDGVDILVAPPKKRARHIGLLSGGERTLTSLALIFAILDVQQPPFIVLDEVDAALDEANSKRFATLLRTRSHTTQSIVISHNRETMASADILYGVTMHSDGTSHLYSVTLEDLQTIPTENQRIEV